VGEPLAVVGRSDFLQGLSLGLAAVGESKEQPVTEVFGRDVSEVEKPMTLTPIRYEVVGHPLKRHRVLIEWRGENAWICTTGAGDALNTDGEFELEPLPSNRTDEFIERTRFDTPESALANFEKHLGKFDRW
jgi:hypothetical protein